MTVALLNDTVYEDNEQFNLTVVVNDTVSHPDPFFVEGSVAVTILDNDGTHNINCCAELLHLISALLKHPRTRKVTYFDLRVTLITTNIIEYVGICL